MGLFTVESFTTFARRCDIGEVLACRRDTRNRHDPFSVATCKGTTVVGHVHAYMYYEV